MQIIFLFIVDLIIKYYLYSQSSTDTFHLVLVKSVMVYMYNSILASNQAFRCII